jgi:Short C-terminal domain
MPGLLRGVARTAVVAGTATAVSNRVSRRQAARWQQQGSYPYNQPEPAYAEPQPADEAVPEPPPPAPAADPIQQLKDLAALCDQGVLTDEEFATQKARILGS